MVSQNVSEFAAEQRGNRQDKSQNIGGVRDGAKEALKSIGRGVFGLTDIVTVPVQGYKDGGAKGFAVGFGKGLVAGVGKPVSHLGSASIDIGSGITAHIQRRRESNFEPSKCAPVAAAQTTGGWLNEKAAAVRSNTEDLATHATTQTAREPSEPPIDDKAAAPGTGGWLREKAAAIRSKTEDLATAAARVGPRPAPTPQRRAVVGDNDFNKMR